MSGMENPLPQHFALIDFGHYERVSGLVLVALSLDKDELARLNLWRRWPWFVSLAVFLSLLPDLLQF